MISLQLEFQNDDVLFQSGGCRRTAVQVGGRCHLRPVGCNPTDPTPSLMRIGIWLFGQRAIWFSKSSKHENMNVFCLLFWGKRAVAQILYVVQQKIRLHVVEGLRETFQRE